MGWLNCDLPQTESATERSEVYENIGLAWGLFAASMLLLLLLTLIYHCIFVLKNRKKGPWNDMIEKSIEKQKARQELHEKRKLHRQQRVQSTEDSETQTTTHQQFLKECLSPLEGDNIKIMSEYDAGGDWSGSTRALRPVGYMSPPSIRTHEAENLAYVTPPTNYRVVPDSFSRPPIRSNYPDYSSPPIQTSSQQQLYDSMYYSQELPHVHMPGTSRSRNLADDDMYAHRGFNRQPSPRRVFSKTSQI